jgi:hypothetical protein
MMGMNTTSVPIIAINAVVKLDLKIRKLTTKAATAKATPKP